MKMAGLNYEVVKLAHHEQNDYCTSRARYRQGRKLTAVKHILVCGVPALGLKDDLHRLCSKFGNVKSMVFVPGYDTEEFTEVYHVHYARIQSARHAKKNIDCREFFGGILHVCYAPEMETVNEVREKLIQRRKDVSTHTRLAVEEGSSEQEKSNVHYHRKRKHPALPVTHARLKAAKVLETSCIWSGIPVDIDPRINVPPEHQNQVDVYGPLPDEKWKMAGVVNRTFIPQERRNRSSTIPASIVSSGSKQTDPQTVNCSLPLTNEKHSSSNSALKFIPRQLNVKRIVFHSKREK